MNASLIMSCLFIPVDILVLMLLFLSNYATSSLHAFSTPVAFACPSGKRRAAFCARSSASVSCQLSIDNTCDASSCVTAYKSVRSVAATLNNDAVCASLAVHATFASCNSARVRADSCCEAAMYWTSVASVACIPPRLHLRLPGSCLSRVSEFFTGFFYWPRTQKLKTRSVSDCCGRDRDRSRRDRDRATHEHRN